jgi:hypothetical protein
MMAQLAVGIYGAATKVDVGKLFLCPSAKISFLVSKYSNSSACDECGGVSW